MRKPIVDGIFYPAQKNELEAKIETLLSEAPEPVSGMIPNAILVPHAGYNYTGKQLWQLLKKLNIELSCDPSIPLQLTNRYESRLFIQKTFSQTFMTAFSIITNN